jgi:hypothetical protein
MMLNQAHRPTFSNIITKGVKHNTVMTSSMIIKKDVIPSKSGKVKDTVKLALNTHFWKDQQSKHGAINVILDEAHTLFNSRRTMSKVNAVMTDFLALLRRVLGANDAGHGELILISQLDRRIDVIAREMATQIRYHVCHYKKVCSKCGYSWKENNETPEQRWECVSCGSYYIKKENHVIECWHFANIQKYDAWKMMGMQTFHRHYFINDIEQYFKHYSTLQWDNLISEGIDD